MFHSIRQLLSDGQRVLGIATLGSGATGSRSAAGVRIGMQIGLSVLVSVLAWQAMHEQPADAEKVKQAYLGLGVVLGYWLR